MNDIIFFVVGTVLGFVIHGAQKQSEDKSDTELEKLKEEVAYYKKLTKGVIEENMQMRRKLGGWNNPDLRTYDGKLK
jgi:uncharacterized membrane-anchored protein YhcB (DUF1043 family)